MNDEHDESHDDVSRLLAAASGGAGSPESVELPEHVAQRLDDVLAGLVSERAGSNVPAAGAPAEASPAVPAEAADRPEEPPPGAPGDAAAEEPAEVLAGPVPPDEVIGVTELASRRRRRWPRVLVAAAAVSVIGLGVGTMLEGRPGDSGQSEQATAGAGRDGLVADSSGSSADKPKEARDSADQAAPEVERNHGSMALADGSRPPRLRTSSLTADVQDVEDSLTPVPVSGPPSDLSRTCVQPRTGPGDEWLAVRLDGQEAVLVLREPADGRRTADVFTCDSARTPAASTVVDAQ